MLAPGQFESEESPDRRGVLYHSSAHWCPYEIVQYILFLYVMSEQWVFFMKSYNRRNSHYN